MVGLRHGTIVAHHIIFIGPELAGFVLPIRVELEVGFFEDLAVNDRMAGVKRDGFSGQSDNSLHIHNAAAGSAYGDNIAAARLMEQVSQAVHEVDATIFVSRA